MQDIDQIVETIEKIAAIWTSQVSRGTTSHLSRRHLEDAGNKELLMTSLILRSMNFYCQYTIINVTQDSSTVVVGLLFMYLLQRRN